MHLSWSSCEAQLYIRLVAADLDLPCSGNSFMREEQKNSWTKVWFRFLCDLQQCYFTPISKQSAAGCVVIVVDRVLLEPKPYNVIVLDENRDKLWEFPTTEAYKNIIIK